MFEFVDKVVYINLEHRTDRRVHIEEQLSIVPRDKLLRFNAIKDKNGGVGCVKSHIAVLEMAIVNKWKNVLVVEDDMTWNNFEQGYKKLEDLADKPYDCIVLGAPNNAIIDKETYRVTNAQTTTAYLINSHYIQSLIDNLKEGMQLLVKTGRHWDYMLDQYWKKLQEKDNWFIIHPNLVYQTPSYSDLSMKYVDYRDFFNV